MNHGRCKADMNPSGIAVHPLHGLLNLFIRDRRKITALREAAAENTVVILVRARMVMPTFFCPGCNRGLLTCASAQKQTERCHPDETRPFAVREYARIQTFPDNWDFVGSMSQQYKQIGNAVPVNLAKEMGFSAAGFLNECYSVEYFQKNKVVNLSCSY